jgi:signal peptidase I
MSKKNNLFAALTLSLIVLSAVYMVNPSGTMSWDPRARIIGYVPYRIPSGSMAPTLLRGDFILAHTFAYNSAPPNYRDVIVFFYPPNPDMVFVKRVIGLAGDRVEVRDKDLFINGVQQFERYVLPFLDKRRSRKPYSTTVPEGMLFVLGDNRDNSIDSRVWGFVPANSVIGKVTRIWLSDNDERVGALASQTPILE